MRIRRVLPVLLLPATMAVAALIAFSSASAPIPAAAVEEACASRQLTLERGEGRAAAGTGTVDLLLRNEGAEACVLDGEVTVRLHAAHSEVASAATVARQVRLDPGAVASTQLAVRSCAGREVLVDRVGVEGVAVTASTPLHLVVCAVAPITASALSA